MYKGDAGVGYDNKDFEVAGRAVEYMQQKNSGIRDYLGAIQQFEYAAKMQEVSKKSQEDSGIEDLFMYHPKQKPRPLLERESIDLYLKDIA